MSMVAHLGARYSVRGVQQTVAAIAALALVGVSLGAACRCPMKVTANPDRACCCSADGQSTVMVQANTCGNRCIIPQGKAPVGEIALPDSPAPAPLPASVAALHRAFGSPPALAMLVDTPPLTPSSLHPVLRI